MDIDELTACEVALMKATSRLDNTAMQVEANQDARLDDLWQEVLDGYLGWIDDPIYGPEATKRALFLVWYSYNEPAFLTGLGALGKESESRILKKIEKTIGTENLDEATHAMLGGYGWGMPFVLHPENYQTTLFLKKRVLPDPIDVDLGSMANRGMMGDYWARRLDTERQLSSVQSLTEFDQNDLCPSDVSDMGLLICPKCGEESKCLTQDCSVCGWQFSELDDANAGAEGTAEKWLERPLQNASRLYRRIIFVYAVIAIVSTGKFIFFAAVIPIFVLLELSDALRRGH